MKPVPFQLQVLPALLVLFLIYGCGGSGSSGFDAVLSEGPGGLEEAFLLEQDAIDEVTENGGCVDIDGTEICAPDADFEADGPSAGIHASPATLTIVPDSGSDVSCDPTEEESCVFQLSIQQVNFAEGVEFYAAVRFQEEASFWSIGLSPFGPSIDNLSTLELMVRVSRLMPGETALMQLAILVYLPESPLPSPAAGDQLLRDFEADRVYAVQGITVTATSP